MFMGVKITTFNMHKGKIDT